ncbi:MAG: carboxypeptidase regulatory-like domain-containing protein [Chloroflexota bacterium]
MTRIIVAIGFLLFSIVPAAGTYAYDGAAVSHGGTIEGVVKFKGTAPAPKKINVTKDTAVCGKTTKTDQSLIVSNGEVEDAVVYIADIKKGKPMSPSEVKLDQRDCEYHPHVLAFNAGSTVDVINPDGILHNIHSYSKVNTPFNFAQPKFKKTLNVKIEKPEIINIKCDVHSWMNGWLFSAANPYFSVTGHDGSFKLTDVPPGTYTLTVWHDTLGKLSQKVTVKPNQETKVTFELAQK